MTFLLTEYGKDTTALGVKGVGGGGESGEVERKVQERS